MVTAAGDRPMPASPTPRPTTPTVPAPTRDPRVRVIPDSSTAVVQQALLNLVLPPKSYIVLDEYGEDMAIELMDNAETINAAYDRWLTTQRKYNSVSKI